MNLTEKYTGKLCSCGDVMVFAITDPGGARMPLNPEPDVHGLVEVFEQRGNLYCKVHGQTPMFHDGPMYTSHFATCPDADEYRG